MDDHQRFRATMRLRAASDRTATKLTMPISPNEVVS
jgi:hypothetical protein